MIWRLEALSAGGFEGTVLGTVIMPYCSGFGNLVFAFLIGYRHGKGEQVIVNCLVNNVTNLTLLIGLPALIWGLIVVPPPGATPKRKRKKSIDSAPEVDRLSLLLSMLAVLFFTGITWTVAKDGSMSFSDGLVLISVFAFWQLFHVFDVLKTNVRQNKKMRLSVFLNLLILGAGAWGIYWSTDCLVTWLSTVNSGFISSKQIGWLSGWLMVVPNGMLAFYYAWKKKAEVVYTSQVGDGHICIPLCIGIAALFRPVPLPEFFVLGVGLLAASTVVHLFCVAVLGRLPRVIGGLLCLSYGIFIYRGLLP